jgi:hypothetical protein
MARLSLISFSFVANPHSGALEGGASSRWKGDFERVLYPLSLPNFTRESQSPCSVSALPVFVFAPVSQVGDK